MPPERRMVARKSAASQYKPPLRTPRTRSSSPLSLADQLTYIEKWGIKVPACQECTETNLENRCFVAKKISPKCGNCLHAGKPCYFPTTAETATTEVTKEGKTIQDEIIVLPEPGRGTKEPISAEKLMNYDAEDDEPPIITVPSMSPHTSPKSNRPQKSPVRSPHLQTRPKAINVQRTPPLAREDVVPERSTTPTLALGKEDIENLYSPISTGRSLSTPFVDPSSELSLAQRNSAMMAIQQQVDWNVISLNSGVPVDRVLKWWMRASSEMVRRG